MNAYDVGRVGLWIDDPANLPGRLEAIDAYDGQMFTDLYLPASTTQASWDEVKRDAPRLHRQLYLIAGPTEAAATFAARVDTAIKRLSPGVVLLDVERPVPFSIYLGAVYTALRALRPTFIVGWCLEPYQGQFVPAAIYRDANSYIVPQCYYGDMSPVSSFDLNADLELWNTVDTLITGGAARVSPCYGAAGPIDLKGTRGITLPSVYYHGAPTGRLKRGVVFQDDLMAEMRLLP